MSINRKTFLLPVSALVLSGLVLEAQSGRAWNDKDDPAKREAVQREATQYVS